MTTRKPIVLHPALLAICPALYLYSRNTGEVGLGEVAKPVLVLLAATMACLLIWRLLVKDWAKAGLITSSMVLMAFVYVPIYGQLLAVYPVLFGYALARHCLLLPLWGILFLAFVASIVRTRRNLVQLTTFANTLSMILVCFSLLTIGGREWRIAKESSAVQAWERLLAKDDAIRLTPRQPLRDIYYIVLDEYARADVLKKIGYDNTPFLEHLRSKGFYVATNAHSNYHVTFRSLPSTLNLDYLDSLLTPIGARMTDTRLLKMMIEDNRVCRMMKREGYEFVFFPSGFQTTSHNRNADLTVAPSGIALSEFERTLVFSSILAPFITKDGNHRRRLLYTFDQLELIPEGRNPTFTFAHIVCPHQPFVFTANGGRVQRSLRLTPQSNTGAELRKLTKQMYIGQIEYVNKRMEQIIDAIMAKSEVPPIIIIQGDHGFPTDETLRPGLQPRYGNENLSAFYFPDGGDAALYDSFSNVNTFRVILNTYFGADFELLADKID